MYISIWLLIVMYFVVLIIGYATCWFCGNCKLAEAEASEAYWKRNFEHERDAHNGTQKRCMELKNKLKEVDYTGYIRGLNETSKDKVAK